jgi:AAA+ superfamily predicted ATPase
MMTNEPVQSSAQFTLPETARRLQDVLNRRIAVQESLDSQEGILNAAENNYLKKQSGFLNKLFVKQRKIDELETIMTEARASVQSLKDELAGLSVNIDHLHEGLSDEDYALLVRQFEEVCKSEKIWNIVSEIRNTAAKSSASNIIDRKETNFLLTDIDWIVTKCRVFYFKNVNGEDLFLYPSFILQFGTGHTIQLSGIKDFTFTFRKQRFIEPETSIPADSKIIDYAWEKVNKDGTPDMRFSGNFQTPVVAYGSFVFDFTRTGTDTTYYVSNYEAAEAFANSLEKFICPTQTRQEITDSKQHFDYTLQYHQLLTDFSAELVSLNEKIITDTILLEKTEDFLGELSPERFLSYCILFDMCQVARLLKNGDYKHDALETTGLVLATNQIQEEVEDKYLDLGYSVIAGYHSTGLYTGIGKVLVEIGNNANPIMFETGTISAESNLSLPALLKATDHSLFDEYAALLFRFANIIAKADNQVSKKEEKRLKEIYTFLHQPTIIKKNKSIITTNVNESIEDILQELDSLIGLADVKREIRTLINFIKVQKARESSGLKSSSVSYHIVFTGNPGTGKTTVARIIAKIYRALEVLNKGQLVETDRSGLIAEYVGQTAMKVNKTVDSAIDGVLFIDEAYALASGFEQDYGKEAVATLIKRMEDDREKLVVILAGYTGEMNAFIDINPGIKSRFNRYIEFPDYAPAELTAIYELLCKKSEYVITDAAKQKLAVAFERAYTNRDKAFGNGRLVRNVFEKTLEQQANRIAAVASLDRETLTTITEEDIP